MRISWGKGDAKQKPSMGGVWIFSGTTQFSSQIHDVSRDYIRVTSRFKR